MPTKLTTRKGEKTEAISAYLDLHPDAPAGEVVSALKTQGITISLPSVYNFRSNGKRRGATRPARPAASAESNGTSEHGSKSKAVRDAVKQLGRTTPTKEIIDYLAGQGIPVSLALVAKVKSRMKRGKKGKRGRPAKSQVSAAVGNAAPAATKSGQISFDDLIAAKELAERLGGMASLRRTLDVLEKLRTVKSR